MFCNCWYVYGMGLARLLWARAKSDGGEMEIVPTNKWNENTRGK